MDFRFFRNVVIAGGVFLCFTIVFAAATVTSEADLNAQLVALDERIAHIVRANPVDAVMQAKNPADLQRALNSQMEVSKKITLLVEEKSALVTAAEGFIPSDKLISFKSLFNDQSKALNHVRNEINSALRVIDVTPQIIADILLAGAPEDIASRLAEIKAEYSTLDAFSKKIDDFLPDKKPVNFKAMPSSADLQGIEGILYAAGLDPAKYNARSRLLKVFGITEAELSAIADEDLPDRFSKVSKNKQGELTKFFKGSIQELHKTLNGIRAEQEAWNIILKNIAEKKLLTPMSTVANKLSSFSIIYQKMLVSFFQKPCFPKIVLTGGGAAAAPRFFMPPADAKPIPLPSGSAFPAPELFVPSPESVKIIKFANNANKAVGVVGLATTVGDLIIGTDPEYAMTKYMEAMKQCQVNQTQSFFPALWGRIKQGGVNIGVNTGLDDIAQFLADGITGGDFNEQIKQELKDGIADIKKNCPDILMALRADSHFTSGLAQIGVRIDYVNPLILNLSPTPNRWLPKPRTNPPVWIPAFEGVNAP